MGVSTTAQAAASGLLGIKPPLAFAIPDQVQLVIGPYVNGSFSPWVQLTASMPVAAYFSRLLFTASSNNLGGRVQLGVGASGSQVVVFDFSVESNNFTRLPNLVFIPAGSNTWIRGYNRDSQATGNNLEVSTRFISAASVGAL